MFRDRFGFFNNLSQCLQTIQYRLWFTGTGKRNGNHRWTIIHRAGKKSTNSGNGLLQKGNTLRFGDLSIYISTRVQMAGGRATYKAVSGLK